MGIMNGDAVALVQHSLAEIMRQKETAVALFCDRLFLLDPTLRPLFAKAPQQHAEQLFYSLSDSIAQLNQPQTLVTAVKQLGQYHATYGVQDAHYHVMGQALFWTVSQLLHEQYTLPMADAWATVYYMMAGLMKEAAFNAKQAHLPPTLPSQF